MIAALDVQYDEERSMAVAAAVVFQSWTDEVAIAEYTVACSNIQDYVPGDFYRRELPCLLAVLGRIVEPLEIVIVDGYVSLGDKPGMGIRLWEALNQQRPIIGVAKTSFHGARAAEVVRGKAKAPLFVTAAGIDVTEAANNIGRMAGSFRVPSLLKRVDRVARDQLKRSSQSRPKRLARKHGSNRGSDRWISSHCCRPRSWPRPRPPMAWCHAPSASRVQPKRWMPFSQLSRVLCSRLGASTRTV